MIDALREFFVSFGDLGLVAGDKVHVTQGEAHAVLAARLDKTLAPTVVRVPAGHVLTAGLGATRGRPPVHLTQRPPAKPFAAVGRWLGVDRTVGHLATASEVRVPG